MRDDVRENLFLSSLTVLMILMPVIIRMMTPETMMAVNNCFGEFLPYSLWKMFITITSFQHYSGYQWRENFVDSSSRWTQQSNSCFRCRTPREESSAHCSCCWRFVIWYCKTKLRNGFHILVQHSFSPLAFGICTVHCSFGLWNLRTQRWL